MVQIMVWVYLHSQHASRKAELALEISLCESVLSRIQAHKDLDNHLRIHHGEEVEHQWVLAEAEVVSKLRQFRREYETICRKIKFAESQLEPSHRRHWHWRSLRAA